LPAPIPSHPPHCTLTTGFTTVIRRALRLTTGLRLLRTAPLFALRRPVEPPIPKMQFDDLDFDDEALMNFDIDVRLHPPPPFHYSSLPSYPPPLLYLCPPTQAAIAKDAAAYKASQQAPTSTPPAPRAPAPAASSQAAASMTSAPPRMGMDPAELQGEFRVSCALPSPVFLRARS
jgi:hypothetical protein